MDNEKIQPPNDEERAKIARALSILHMERIQHLMSEIVANKLERQARERFAGMYRTGALLGVLPGVAGAWLEVPLLIIFGIAWIAVLIIISTYQRTQLLTEAIYDAGVSYALIAVFEDLKESEMCDRLRTIQNELRKNAEA